MQLHSILRALAFACLLITNLQTASAGQPGQGITLTVTRERLEKVFREIEEQVNVSFVYSRETLSRSKPVTLDVKNEQLDKLLPALFRSQPMTYVVDGAYVIIRANDVKADTLPLFKGRIVNETGTSLAGVTIQVKGLMNVTTSDVNGEFTLRNLTPGSTLLITGAELEPAEISIGNETFISITLKPKMNELDQVLVIAYGETTRRLNTGNIGKVSAAEIQRQPVSNPLTALHGRIAGVNVTQSSGLPGASVNIQIRGDNSISQGSQPLFIVDGVPFMLNQGAGLSVVNGSLIQQSPFNSINPADIESIEVFKDADATAIYGSQGANGVIMITTKKGTAGRTAFRLDYSTGIGTVARKLPLLNTQEYLSMRREAFYNDGTAPTISNAPDLLVWDSTKYTDWTDVFIGGKARTQNLQGTLTGGNQTTQFMLSGSYYSETTVFPGSKPNKRMTGRGQISHSSQNKRLNVVLNTSYSVDQKKLPTNDLTYSSFLAPNAPDLYDASGKLSWTTGLENPMSFLYRRYESSNNTFMSNLNVSYQVLPGTYVKLSAGYNAINFEEQSTTPISAQRPAATTTGSKLVGLMKVNNFVVEPQLEHIHRIGAGKVNVLAGLSFQQRKQSDIDINATQYLNDDLLEILASAPRLTISNSQSQYNYAAGFARISYNLKNRYLINVNLRRDGSSRFGPANRFSTFGALGAGWIFSDESFMKNQGWLSFGKLRASYGITGNDQIADYGFLDLWTSSTSYQYQGQTGVLQQRLFNPYLQWERNKKAELGLELGFLENNIKLAASYYLNRSDNQLVSLPLPSQTGFSSIQGNLDAVVQNTGLELEFSANIINKSKFRWTTQANVTIPRNKLISYPDLASSSTRLSYEVGEPLNIYRRYVFTGINPQTGVYEFLDVNKDGSLSADNDYQNIGVYGPSVYGGMAHQLSYKNLQLDLFFEFKEQNGTMYFTSLSTAPGSFVSSAGNQPAFVLDRWQKPGDVSLVQKFTTGSTTVAGRAYQTARSSSLMLGNTSLIRLKNISFSWLIPVEKLRHCSLRWYISAQNLFTISGYKGIDPESQNLQRLPPLRVIVTGVTFQF